MGSGPRITIHSFPTWVRTIDNAIEAGAEIKACCTTCGQSKAVDLQAVRAAKGGSYSLINRRNRCRFTRGCAGWACFHYKHGVFRPLWDDDTGLRWMFGSVRLDD